MTNREILQLSNGLQMCGDLKGVKLAFALAKNAKILGREVEPLAETIKKLQEEHAKKDKDGKPIVKDNVYEMEDLEKFNEEYKKLMDIEVEVSLHKVKESEVPADISTTQASIILDLIDEKETKTEEVKE